MTPRKISRSAIDLLHWSGYNIMIDFPVRTKNTKCTDTSIGPGWMGTYVAEEMSEVGQNQFRMEIITGTAAKKLLANEDAALQQIPVWKSHGYLCF